MNAVIALVGGPGAILEPYTLRLMRLPNQAEGYPNPTFWHFSYGLPVFSDAYKDFYGLRCRRIDFRHPRVASPAGEAWISQDKGIVISDSGTADGVTFEWNVTALEFGEPDASLFAIPTDYEEAAEP